MTEIYRSDRSGRWFGEFILKGIAMGLLQSHLDAVESKLLATSLVPANAGHSIHKGTPRETFIREFLEEHLSQNLAIGTGEIIDANSKVGESRNQMDIVLYRKEFPRLSFGGGIYGFLAESVVATIEAKSTLTSHDLATSMVSAHRAKRLSKSVIRGFEDGYRPPNILSFVVAYDGPASMETVHGWLEPICKKEGINYPSLPAHQERQKRQAVSSTSVDAIFVLGRGAVTFDTWPLKFVADETYQSLPDLKWIIADVDRGALALLFLWLTSAASGVCHSWLDATPYLRNLDYPITCSDEP